MKCSLDNPKLIPYMYNFSFKTKWNTLRIFFIYFFSPLEDFEICIQTNCSLYTDLQDATNIENAFMRVARELKSRYENGSQLQANIMDDAVILESRSVDSKWCGCGWTICCPVKEFWAREVRY